MRYEAEARLRHVGLWTPDDMPFWAREAWGDSPGPGATGTAVSNYLEDEMLDHVLSKATFTSAATLYYALFTVSPSDAGGGTEVSGGGYVRQGHTNNATNFPAASAGSKSNGTAANFGTASANWGTVGHVAVIDASSGGNYYFWGSMAVSIPIQGGDSLTFPIGSLVFGLD